MIIAFTARGNSSVDLLDSRFGRAKFILLYDSEKKNWSAIDNQVNLEAAQGAGIQTAQRIVDQNVNVVVTGNCGPKAYRVLQAADIEVYSSQELSLDQVLKLYESQKLTLLNEANVESHWV